MPVRITVQGIYPPKNILVKNGEVILEAIKSALEVSVGDLIEGAMERRTQGWDSAPRFRRDLTVAPTRYSLLVMPAGQDKIKWVRVSGGVPPHFIGVRRAKMLRIRGGRGGYRPHTKPGNVYGGPGSYAGVTAYARAVPHHPGIRPREFERHIVAEEKERVFHILWWAAESAARTLG